MRLNENGNQNMVVYVVATVFRLLLVFGKERDVCAIPIRTARIKRTDKEIEVCVFHIWMKKTLYLLKILKFRLFLLRFLYLAHIFMPIHLQEKGTKHTLPHIYLLCLSLTLIRLYVCFRASLIVCARVCTSSFNTIRLKWFVLDFMPMYWQLNMGIGEIAL